MVFSLPLPWGRERKTVSGGMVDTTNPSSYGYTPSRPGSYTPIPDQKHDKDNQEDESKNTHGVSVTTSIPARIAPAAEHGDDQDNQKNGQQHFRPSKKNKSGFLTWRYSSNRISPGREYLDIGA
jgi:hypothetical protein